MASSMFSTTATVASKPSINHANPSQATMVASFTGLKSTCAFPVTQKTTDITSLASHGGRVQCMQVWTPVGKKKYETLSYLPPLKKSNNFFVRNGFLAWSSSWRGFVYRENHRSPGYYDGRYWTMWKLPMFGCHDPVLVLKELDEAIKAYPKSFIRIIGFDNVRQVQFFISFFAYKPEGY